jgi:hypothetical protein
LLIFAAFLPVEVYMKNSKEYVKKITNLYHNLKHKHTKIEPPVYKQVAESLIYGIISEKLSEKESHAAIKRFSEYFVDYNDLRVSRADEIAELMGSDTAANRQAALTLTAILQKIFNENHQITLESLHKLGKRQARQKLEKLFSSAAKILPQVPYSSAEAIGLVEPHEEQKHDSDIDNEQPPLLSLPQDAGVQDEQEETQERTSVLPQGAGQFAIDYCMLTSLASHCIPLTEKMIEYLKANDLVEDKADAQTIEGFLSKQISAKNGYEFYALLRHESETAVIAAKPNYIKKASDERKSAKEKKEKTKKEKTKKAAKTEKTPQPPPRLLAKAEAGAGKKKEKK